MSALIVERSVDTNTASAQRIDELLTQSEFRKLAYHQRNGDTMPFVIGFLKPSDMGLISQYVQAKNVSFDDAVRDSWLSIRGLKIKKRPSLSEPFKSGVPEPFTCVPRKVNSDGKSSTWLTFDIDAHNGENPRYALITARDIYNDVLGWLADLNGETVCALWEDSGRGHHITVLSLEPRKVGWWRRLIAAATCQCGDSDIEIIGMGKLGTIGCRLPGTANPNTWNGALATYDVSRICAHTGLREFVRKLSNPPLLEKQVHSDSQDEWLIRLAQNCQIDKPGTRHNQLRRLISEAVYQCGEKILERLATDQHKASNCTMKANKDDHLTEARNMIRSWRARIIDSLNEKERAAYNRISDRSPLQKEAFLIVQNFSKSRKDIPIGTKFVGMRVGVRWETVIDWRRLWIRRGWITETKAARPPKLAAVFKWNL
jgi:hypothetical protein